MHGASCQKLRHWKLIMTSDPALLVQLMRRALVEGTFPEPPQLSSLRKRTLALGLTLSGSTPPSNKAAESIRQNCALIKVPGTKATEVK